MAKEVKHEPLLSFFYLPRSQAGAWERENLVTIKGHKGPHPQEYHEYVETKLKHAVKSKKPYTPEYKKAVTEALNRIKIEATTSGSQVNKWLTKQK